MAHLSSGTRYMYLHLTIRPYDLHINLDQGVYTTDELVTALNAAIETQGSVGTCQGISRASRRLHNYNFHRLH